METPQNSMMERITKALFKVEQIKASEEKVYADLRKDLKADIQASLSQRPVIKVEIDYRQVARELSGAMNEQSQLAREAIETATATLRNESNRRGVILGYLSIFLGLVVVVLGYLTWHYSGYKEAAYKYSFLQKDIQLGYYEKVGLKSAISYMDSVSLSNFSEIEHHVDTTDVAKVLALRAAMKAGAIEAEQAAQGAKRKKKIVGHTTFGMRDVAIDSFSENLPKLIVIVLVLFLLGAGLVRLIRR